MSKINGVVFEIDEMVNKKKNKKEVGIGWRCH